MGRLIQIGSEIDINNHDSKSRVIDPGVKYTDSDTEITTLNKNLFTAFNRCNISGPV